MLADAHCHFFSSRFFATLGRDAGAGEHGSTELPARLGWEAPGSNRALADRWLRALDEHRVDRAMLIASVPGDEASVEEAVQSHPSRFVGAFMLNPAAPDAEARVERALASRRLRTVCLFPAMHHVGVDDSRTDAIFAAAARHRAVLFVHCGVLSIGIRKKLKLPSRFDLRLGDPLAVAAAAARHPDATVIIPHFGAGFFREALMAVSAAPNVVLDTSSSNSWIKFTPGLSLRDVFARALEVAGPSRLLFGTDSSFFPRGWQRPIYDEQRGVLADLGVSSEDEALILGGNFARIFDRA
jgi:predicted TIM-barrel fold metal-dependent hydrolase